ncbi:hypothetical protein F4814DRAFT_447278 [Daldinia grandis]|nr:hypothetical protein F4814DRAFT_447278 [Daldinia grandis]
MAENDSPSNYGGPSQEEHDHSEGSGWETEVDDSAIYHEIDYESEGLFLCNRYEIMAYAKHLTPYFDYGNSHLSNEGDPKAPLPDGVVTELQKWLGEEKSRMIWIQGLPNSICGSNLSLAAVRIASMFQEDNMPCISFFVKPVSNSAPSDPQHQAAVIALLYSIIAQLIYLLPIEFEDTDKLDEDKFLQLDGSFGSASVALQIIQALLKHAPRALVWVLDGFQRAENQETTPHLEALLDVLRAQESMRTSRVCFTTDDISAVLYRRLHVLEQFYASEAGGSGIDELCLPWSRFS